MNKKSSFLNLIKQQSTALEPSLLAKIITCPEFCKKEINLLDGILAYKTIDHEIICGNDKLLKYNGYTQEREVIGKTDYDLVYQEYTPIYHTQEDEALKFNCYNALHPGKDVSGRAFLFLNRKYPWMNEKGDILGIISFSVEIKDPHLITLGHSLKKSAIENPTGIHYVSKENPFNILTNREIECLFYLIRGKTAKGIAKILNISFRTVESHLITLKTKLSCHNKGDLIEYAIQHGFMQFIPNTLFNKKLKDSLDNF